MHRTFSIALIAFLLFTTQNVSAQIWSDFWQQFSYRKTNYADVAPEKAEDFSILISALRGGYRLYLINENIKIGFDGYLRLENVNDFMKNTLHNHIYNNHNKGGIGIKLHVQQVRLNSYWLNYFQIDAFCEYQGLSTFYKEIKWYDAISKNNGRVGINSWVNSGNSGHLQYETYFDFSYHTTNFADKGNTSYLIFTLSPRFIVDLGFFDFYLNEEIVIDFLKEKYNRNPYSNNFKSIIGSRIIFPFYKYLNESNFLYHASFLLFTEYSHITYLDDKADWSFQSEISDYDFRIGFIFYLPFGESKYRPAGHFRP
jgi:hypothetical protein